MHACRICKFPVELDDVQFLFPSGRCICVRCYHHEIEDEEPVPKHLRQEVEAAANA